jgi:septum formation protein
MKVVLASTSPRRKQLLKLLLSDFKIEPADINEDALAKLARTPDEMVQNLARAKAQKVAHITKSSPDIIIAADTSVVLALPGGNWQQIGKAKNQDEARNMLKDLRNTTHFVFTGVSVLNPKTSQSITFYDKGEVTFKKFSDAQLELYLKTKAWQGKAGAYGIQDEENVFIKDFKGASTGIIGLPLTRLAQILEDFEVKLRPDWQNHIGKFASYAN